MRDILLSHKIMCFVQSTPTHRECLRTSPCKVMLLMAPGPRGKTHKCTHFNLTMMMMMMMMMMNRWGATLNIASEQGHFGSTEATTVHPTKPHVEREVWPQQQCAAQSALMHTKSSWMTTPAYHMLIVRLVCCRRQDSSRVTPGAELRGQTVESSRMTSYWNPLVELAAYGYK